MGSGFSTHSVMVPDFVPVFPRKFGLHTRSGTPSLREAKPDPVFLAADEQGRLSLPKDREARERDWVTD